MSTRTTGFIFACLIVFLVGCSGRRGYDEREPTKTDYLLKKRYNILQERRLELIKRIFESEDDPDFLSDQERQDTLKADIITFNRQADTYNDLLEPFRDHLEDVVPRLKMGESVSYEQANVPEERDSMPFLKKWPPEINDE